MYFVNRISKPLTNLYHPGELRSSRRFSSCIFTPESKIDPYWIPHIAAITRPSALALLPQLTDSNALGFRSEGPVRAVSLLADAKRWKAEHPTKVVLVRVGEFFEAFGLDAALLVQHAGLNPMAGRPRAGCPRQNLTAVVTALTEAGLSVAVYEEASEVARSKNVKTKKSRFLAHVVTPGMPGFVQESDILRNDSIAYIPARPFAYISHNSRGYMLYMIHADAKECKIHHNLTEEACATMLETSGGLAEPLFYSSVPQRLNGLLPSRRVKVNVAQSAGEADILDVLCAKISSELSLSSPLCNLRVLKEESPALKPLYRSAAQALGLVHNEAQATPSLAREILPPHAAPFALRFVQKWLLCPPNARLRSAMHQLVLGFCGLKTPMPDFRPVGVEKTVRLLEERKANASFFLEIKQCCAGVLGMMDAANTQLNQCLFDIASSQSGVRHLDLKKLRSQLELVSSRIDHVVVSDLRRPEGTDESMVPSNFFDANEAALGAVKVDLGEFNAAKTHLIAAAADEVKVGHVAIVHFDAVNNLLFSKKKTTTHAIDRKGERISGKFTTERILAAQIAYLHEAEFLTSEAKCKLKELAADVSEFLPAVVLASHWSVVASVASLHAELKLRRNWSFPTIRDPRSSSQLISFEGLCPYWLDPPPRGSATTSDVMIADGEGPVLLTAPNMSGKSTFLRSLAAAVVLGSCGFSVPARVANFCTVSNLIFVSPSGDRPVDGVSAFAAEVEAMAIAIRDTAESGSRSLVLVDEFGRGTSSADGTALTAALLEHFSKRNAQIACIFASHLHEVFKAKEAITANLVFWKMHGHALAYGTCTDSLGIETARNFGLAAEVCDRARQLKARLSGDPVEQDSPLFLHQTHQPSIRSVYESSPHMETVSRPDTNCFIEATILRCLSSVLPTASDRTISISVDEKLPPVAQASAVVYVLLLGDGGVYVGESDNFARRVAQHKRSKKEGIKRVIVTPVDSKGEARLAETALINALSVTAGIKLRSVADGRRKSNALVN